MRHAAAFVIAFVLAAAPAVAETAARIETKVDLAIEEMHATVQGARELSEQAKGVLVMPDVKKAGLVIGGAYGEGALRVDGVTVGYYSLTAASIGWQLGVQSSKHVLFFMTDAALAQFRASKGWEVGVDAEVTVPGDGLSVGLDTTSAKAPVIAIVFGQNGLLAGASVEGAKFSPIDR